MRTPVLGRVEERDRIVHLGDLAGVHEDDPVRDLMGESHLVRDADHRHALFRKDDRVSNTSLTASGSSTDVGSSNSMIFGFKQSDRAIAARCCWPPDN